MRHWADRQEGSNVIIDYSTFRPTIEMLKGAGVTSVGRYIGWDSVPGYPSEGKNITKDEAGLLTSNGISVFVSFEYEAAAAMKGSAQGQADGTLASEQLAALAAPDGVTVYFAIDFDIPDFAPGSSDPKAKLGAAADYFAAINALHRNYVVGVYGGFYAVSRLLSAGLAEMAWQTSAWSGGQWDNRAVLRQLGQMFGSNADINTPTPAGADFGQWPRPRGRQPQQFEADGTVSLANAANQHGRAVSDVLWLTAQHQPGGYAATGVPYLNAGQWGTPMPKGMIFWA
jgi:hypothetical protein